MATATQVRRAVEAQHPDAGVTVLDGRGGRVLGHRPRNDDCEDAAVMDAVVILDAPPVDDARQREVTDPE
jgi:hypothetical protein